jgi:P27 family predicted phage terminase small subunit
MITELYYNDLTMLCQGWQEYLDNTEQVKKSGILVKSPNGFPVLNPYLIAANQAIKKVRSLLAEFGMTPASRSRIQATATSEESDDEWSKLLK